MTISSRRQFFQFILHLFVGGLASALGFHNTCCQGKKHPTPAQKDLTNSREINFTAGYLKLHRTGELKKRGEQLWARMESCDLCPRECGAERLSGERGFCQANADLEIASYHPHFGEEQPLVGQGGSGTIFFSNCGLRCVFCR